MQFAAVLVTFVTFVAPMMRLEETRFCCPDVAGPFGVVEEVCGAWPSALPFGPPIERRLDYAAWAACRTPPRPLARCEEFWVWWVTCVICVT